MSEPVLFRWIDQSEICDNPTCKHAQCKRYRDLLCSPCVFCHQHHLPNSWIADLRSTRLIADDVWYAGFAHQRCIKKYLKGTRIRMKIDAPRVNPLTR